MYLCYFDESGDPGVPSATKKSITDWFVLGCVVVDDADWFDVLNSLVNLRRTLRGTYGILPSNELKGAYFRNGKGPFKGLGISRRDRMKIYRDLMTWQTTQPIKVFAIAIHKADAAARGWEPRYCAWTFALQRLDRMSREEDDRCMIFPDEGNGHFLRQRVRSMRRYHQVPSHYGPETIPMPVERILEDPNERQSDESYFVQIADLNAYAAHRSIHIDPKRKMANDVWDCLDSPFGEARLLKVNSVTGGPKGIVKYPS